MAHTRIRSLIVPAAVAAGLLLAPASASATIVWSSAGQILAANDDMTSVRALTSAAALGMQSVGSTHVGPAGDTVMFTGSTNVNRHFCGTTAHFGFSSTGVYSWTPTGGVRRMSPAPLHVQCATALHLDPEATSDGRYVNGYFHCTGQVSGQIGSYSCIRRVHEERLDGTGFKEYTAACSSPEDPSPDPADPSRIVYVGCAADPSGAAIVASGDNRANELFLGADDVQPHDPSFRADGAYVVQVEGGGDPGLWTLGSTPATVGQFRHLLTEPSGATFDDPRYMGATQDRIVFSASTSSGEDLYSIPASCTAQTCSFPGSATRLTSDGSSSAPAWTSATLAAPAVPAGPTGPAAPAAPPPPPPAPTTTATGQPTTGGSSSGTGSGGSAAPTLTARKLSKGRLTDVPTASAISKAAGGGGSRLLRTGDLGTRVPKRFTVGRRANGLLVALTAKKPGTLRLRLRRGKKVLTTSGAQVTKAGSAGFVMRLPKTLRTGKHSLEVRWSPAKRGKAVTRRATLTVRR